jgi:hypothetical protein
MLASAIVAPVTTISSGAGQRQEFRRNRAPPLPQRMHQAALLPSVEIRFRGLHTGGFKAFAEAIVNRLQKATCLGGTWGPTRSRLNAVSGIRSNVVDRSALLIGFS